MHELSSFRHIHFVGIGGAGMSAIANVLLARGFTVSGSDRDYNATAKRLKTLGAVVMQGHLPEHVRGADLVVTSTAIGPENPERRAAETAGIPIWHRARVLAAIMRDGRSIAVSGTHGKTTTTSMMGLMLVTAGWDPTVLVGGELHDFGGNARPGAGEWVVAEADESDASFLQMDPDRIIVTNVEADHLDFYDGQESIIRTFGEFFDRLRPDGRIIACIDDPILAEMLDKADRPVITYGVQHPEAQMRVESLEYDPEDRHPRFVPVWRGERLGEIRLGVAGRHNVQNALGALACGLELGAPFEPMAAALAAYRGAKRRYQLMGRCEGVSIIDDYAHHPTEIRATLAVARDQAAACNGRVVGVFQPHRYSRTQRLADQFGEALQQTDLVVVTDVYGAGEAPIPGVSGRSIHDEVVARGHADAHYLPTLEEAGEFLGARIQPGDLCLTLGAGNVWQVGQSLLETLAHREQTPH